MYPKKVIEMNYEIMNRHDARQVSYHKSGPVTAMISITDPYRDKNEFYPQPWLVDILEIQFCDLLEDHPGCMTRNQALIIAKFVMKYYAKVEKFIVHCEYGQSRSAAIAAIISKFYEGHDNDIFKNPQYHPDRTCYFYLLEALKGT